MGQKWVSTWCTFLIINLLSTVDSLHGPDYILATGLQLPRTTATSELTRVTSYLRLHCLDVFCQAVNSPFVYSNSRKWWLIYIILNNNTNFCHGMTICTATSIEGQGLGVYIVSEFRHRVSCACLSAFSSTESSNTVVPSLDPRPHFLEEWAWYRLLACACANHPLVSG